MAHTLLSVLTVLLDRATLNYNHKTFSRQELTRVDELTCSQNALWQNKQTKTITNISSVLFVGMSRQRPIYC